MGRFSKLPYLLGMRLGDWQKIQKLHIYSLSTPMGTKLSFNFRSMDSGFWDAGWFSKLLYLDMKFSQFGQSSRNCTYYLSTLGGQKRAYFRSTGSGFWDMGWFQNCLIWAWNMAIVQNYISSRSCTYTLFLPQRIEIELIFSLQAAVSEIRADFQNCHIWA